MIERSIKIIKKIMENIIIVDCAETKYGDVFFSVDNQPLLVEKGRVMGLNYNYAAHRKIITEAHEKIEGKS